MPTCGDQNLLTGLLRDQWGFDGFVVGDYDAYAQIFTSHEYTKDMVHAAALGLNAGIDQEGGGTSAIATLPDNGDGPLRAKAGDLERLPRV